jgi:hypothetical protein
MAFLINRNTPTAPPLLAGPRAELLRIVRRICRSFPRDDLGVSDDPEERPGCSAAAPSSRGDGPAADVSRLPPSGPAAP